MPSPSLDGGLEEFRGFCLNLASSSAIRSRASVSSARVAAKAATASASSRRSDATSAPSTSHDGSPSSRARAGQTRSALPGPIGTLTAAARADGEETSKVTQAGPVTMTPPAKPVKRRPHTGNRTSLREAATSAWPDAALISPPMRDGEPYTSLALAGRVM